MIKKILQLVVVLFIAAQGVIAQTPEVFIADNVMYQPGDIAVEVDMLYFTDDIGAITLHIGFDADLMDFVGLDNTALSGNWFANQVGNTVLINYVAPYGTAAPINGKLLDLLFEYKGGFSSDLIFDEANCEIADGNLGVITCSYTNGMVQQDPAGALTVSMTDLIETIGNTAEMPVTIVGGDQYDVEAISLKIAFNENELAFGGIVDGAITGAYASASDGIVTINWTGTESFGSSDTLLKVLFEYNGGNADAEFIPGCEFSTASALLPVLYIDGSVTATAGTASMTISTITGASPGSTVNVPVVAADFGSSVIGAINMNISFDNSLLSYAGYSAQQLTGWFVTASNTDGEVTLQWSDANGANLLPDSVVTLAFVYDIDTIGGLANIEFEGGSTVDSVTLVTIPVSFIGGSIAEETLYTVSGQLTYMGDVTRPVGTSGSSTTTVLLKNAADSTIAYITNADADGNYSFSNVASGSFFIDAATTIDAKMSYDITDAYIIYGIGGTLTGLQALAADVNEDGVDVTDAYIVYGSVQAGNVKVPAWTAPDWFFENPAVVVSGDVTQDFGAICSGDANGDFVPIP